MNLAIGASQLTEPHGPFQTWADPSHAPAAGGPMEVFGIPAMGWSETLAVGPQMVPPTQGVCTPALPPAPRPPACQPCPTPRAGYRTPQTLAGVQTLLSTAQASVQEARQAPWEAQSRHESPQPHHPLGSVVCGGHCPPRTQSLHQASPPAVPIGVPRSCPSELLPHALWL